MSDETDSQRPKRRPRALGRRSVLRGAALGAATGLVSSTTTTAGAAVHSAPSAGSASFRWLGTSGWRIDVNGRTVLFDPYITRFKTGLFCGEFHPGTELTSDPALIDEHVDRPEIVLVSHSHWDHISDVPHIAKTTGARIVGTETTFHLLVALGVDREQISVVKGGEILDFAGITVEVVSSRHSRNKNYSYFAPGTLHAPPARAPHNHRRPARGRHTRLPGDSRSRRPLGVPDGRQRLLRASTGRAASRSRDDRGAGHCCYVPLCAAPAEGVGRARCRGTRSLGQFREAAQRATAARPDHGPGRLRRSNSPGVTDEPSRRPGLPHDLRRGHAPCHTDGIMSPYSAVGL
ncbi:Beta-lactamase superfamily domain-containing protein [Streptomyces sp. BvitLS-983]|nr:Beta-lactamase superfamily domain-containing protein [Streptomyces sp. BvitLS-983]